MNGSGVRLTVFLMGLIVAMIVLPGCGGGGGGGGVSSEVSSPSGSVTALEWDPPTVAVDGTPLDPRRDLDYYEFYLRTDQNFTENDQPVAQVAASCDVLSKNGKSFKRELTTDFTLDNLLPFTEKGKQYYVSIRAVGVDGLKSGFMVPVPWDLS
jgi:hypothetical protein